MIQWIRDIKYSVHLSGVKGTAIGLFLLLVIILGAFTFNVGCYVKDTGKRIDTWCSRKLIRLSTWRT